MTRPKGATPPRRPRRPEPRMAADPLHGLRLTNPDRVLYPTQGITKRELAQYLHAVAAWMLPHVVDRPLTLVRCPAGTGQPCIYMKHSGVWAPPGLHRHHIREKRKLGTYLTADDELGLLGLAQMGVLEIHTWNSVTSQVEHPDRVVFDLDPDEDLPWSRVVEAALLLRVRLGGLGLESFVKTTGGKGLHVVVPIAPALGWDDCLTFTRVVAQQLAREQPSRYTAEMSRARRRGKVLIDYLRNNRGSTSVAAFSPRARGGATVSVPISWEELASGVLSRDFNIRNVPARLSALPRDPWRRYWNLQQDLLRAAR